jgi:hypothetical protein
MTTNTLTKVDTKWETKKVQEKTAHIMAVVNLAAFEVLSKVSPEAVTEFQTIVRKHKVEAYKAMGVKTPLELVKAMAETEHNLFGSVIEISGDDHKAVLKYDSCAMWTAMEKVGKFTPEQQEKMGKNFENCSSLLAKELGMTGTTVMDKDTCIVTFTK